MKQTKCRVVLYPVIIFVLGMILITQLSGCAYIESEIQSFKGSIVGTAFTCEFYDNEGQKFMNVHGQKIDMSPNVIRELTYNEDGTRSYTETLSSVMTITIDGSQIESCGSTILFIEDGLKPDANFIGIDNIESSANGFGDNTMIAGIVNQYKNLFGKPTVVVIQSQLGDPICAFSGNDVYWEVLSNLPKTTKLMIDGKALYIHRANFQIVDKTLLN